MTNSCEECLVDLGEAERRCEVIRVELFTELERLTSIIGRLPLEHESTLILLRNLRRRYPQEDAKSLAIRSGCLRFSKERQESAEDFYTMLEDYQEAIHDHQKIFMRTELCKYFGHVESEE